MADNVSCRRCSVLRVNALCRLYEEGFRDKMYQPQVQLKSLVKTAEERGYPYGSKILFPDLAPDQVRRMCWNIASLLIDKDFQRLGVSLNGRRKPTLSVRT
jgi:hypothetical protein